MKPASNLVPMLAILILASAAPEARGTEAQDEYTRRKEWLDRISVQTTKQLRAQAEERARLCSAGKAIAPNTQFFDSIREKLKAPRAEQIALAKKHGFPSPEDAETYAANGEWAKPQAVKRARFSVYSPKTEEGGSRAAHGQRIRILEESLADNILHLFHLSSSDRMPDARQIADRRLGFLEAPARYVTVAGAQSKSAFATGSRLRIPGFDQVLAKHGLSPVEFRKLDTGNEVIKDQLDIAVAHASDQGLERPKNIDWVVEKFHESVRYHFLSEEAIAKEQAESKTPLPIPEITPALRAQLREKLAETLYGTTLPDGTEVPGVYSHMKSLMTGKRTSDHPTFPVLEYAKGMYSTGRAVY